MAFPSTARPPGGRHGSACKPALRQHRAASSCVLWHDLRSPSAMCSPPPRVPASQVTEHYFGGGSNGIAWLESLTQGLASEGDTSVFFKVRCPARCWTPPCVGGRGNGARSVGPVRTSAGCHHAAVVRGATVCWMGAAVAACPSWLPVGAVGAQSAATWAPSSVSIARHGLKRGWMPGCSTCCWAADGKRALWPCGPWGSGTAESPHAYAAPALCRRQVERRRAVLLPYCCAIAGAPALLLRPLPTRPCYATSPHCCRALWRVSCSVVPTLSECVACGVLAAGAVAQPCSRGLPHSRFVERWRHACGSKHAGQPGAPAPCVPGPGSQPLPLTPPQPPAPGLQTTRTIARTRSTSCSSTGGSSAAGPSSRGQPWRGLRR